MRNKALVVIDIQNDIHVISDCVISYDLKKLPEMLTYYAAKGCEVWTLAEYQCRGAQP